MGQDACELLTTEEVGARLKVPAETVRYWRHVGTGPRAIKVGRFVRYREDDLSTWLDARRQATA